MELIIDPQLKFEIIKKIKSDINSLIKSDVFDKNADVYIKLLRTIFEFFAKNDFFQEGLNFFKVFNNIIKQQKFNSLKTFLFYFAYQSKNFNLKIVKELIEQDFMITDLKGTEDYLDFCIYCFYKGLYHIERKNYFMASYLYCIPLKIGFSFDDIYLFNQYTLVMLKFLCFLKVLSDYDIQKSFLRKKEHYIEEKFKTLDIDECISFLINENIDLDTFNDFTKKNKDFIQKYHLIGLKNEAETFLVLKKVRELLSNYKVIKMKNLSQISNIKYDELIKIIQKKVMEGELNVKYDEENDMLEVFDIDPGKQERVNKTQELYSNILQGNKNLFISFRDEKMNELFEEGKQGMNHQFIINTNSIENEPILKLIMNSNNI